MNQQLREVRAQQELDALEALGVDREAWIARSFRDAARQGEFDHLDAFIRPDEAAVDVGANVGAYTCKLAANCRRVLAIEPVPAQTWLRSALPMNCVFAGCAAGEQHGTMGLKIPRVDGSEATGLASFSPLVPKLYPDCRSTTVRVRPLDALVAELMPHEPIGLVKIDAEGWELPVLRGAVGVLRQHRPNLKVEIWPEHVAETGPVIEAMGYRGLFFFGHVLHDLSAYDRSVHAAPENDWNPRSPETFRAELHVNNFFFVPRD